ncbi:sulfite exporter TauE/SafE family protein [Skermania sp. ID1734]|uniref:sulfite exporter TauE/SafE family protein n=1 Tax=Skermania sp. ID1734 TaxID=2597516 RepID=UPI00117E27F5|nr:sulfite exporter TauE/SafE family protein [Skermania sp. ID1734]TSE01955.1 sulfite exporter TauE/SafE family protein [Skermania sp. ID1734]
MSPVDFLLLVVAGFVTGIVGFVTGLASLVSYPALLAAGLPPVTANVTNTVALVAVGVGATANSTRELAGRGPRLAWWAAIAALGGVVGALILLVASAKTFELVVPVLVAGASIALLAQPTLRKRVSGTGSSRLLPVAIFLVAVYGGYFGAGAGVVFVATILLCTGETIWQATILKSFLLGIANLVAAVYFAIFAHVHWLAALALALGALVGGWCGPPVVRMVPPTVLRIVVGIGGLGLAAWLAIA